MARPIRALGGRGLFPALVVPATSITGLDNIHLTSPAAPSSDEVVLDSLAFVNGSFKVAASGMTPSKSYVLRRSTVGESFTDIGDPFTGGSSRILVDPNPPAGSFPVLYQVREVAP